MNRSSRRVMIVEDVASLADTYAAYLASEPYETVVFNTGTEAMASLELHPPSAIVLDAHLPDMDGFDILRRVKAAGLPTEVIVITGQGSIKLAVEAMRHGAFDFVMKPFTADRLRVTVRNALERRKMADEIAVIKEETGGGVGRFIGDSLPMQVVYRILRSAAPSNASVFVTGESGTGKELCAEAVHSLSKRRDGPFVVLNCAAIPRDLLESEIFGHVKGAFTGATSDRKGAALQANGGTLFLDEIGEMDIGLQSKMLRFLQDKSVRRVGDDSSRTVDVRIVCATNRDPLAEVAAGRFREDLFYRLHVVPVELPPLREREGDAVLIARHFLKMFAEEDGKNFTGFSPEAEAAILRYRWPGNIRQLQNVVRSIVVINDGPVVDAGMLPREMSAAIEAEPALPVSRGVSGTAVAAPAAHPAAHDGGHHAHAAHAGDSHEIRPLDDVIRSTIEHAIEHCGGNIPKAAAALEVSPSTLYRRIQAWQDVAQAKG